MRERTLGLGLMLALLCGAAYGGDPDALNGCTGQPVLVGTFGENTAVNAFPSGTTFTDSFDTTFGNGCAPGLNQEDSAVCFTPSLPCTIDARLEGIGFTSASMNVINACDTRPPSCSDSGSGVGSAGVGNVFLPPDFLVCFVGSALGAPSSGQYIFTNLDACGELTGGGGDEIFADGFESGDTSAWSSTVP